MKEKTRGQSLVEFALILPILLLLLLGIIEGARIVWAYITVQNAAREAARYAVTGQPYDEFGNPWTGRPDRYTGCDPQFNDSGQLIYSPDLLGGGDCTEPNDRVDSIIGVALERGRQLGVDQYAIHPAVYTATGWVNNGGTFGVRVFGQETGSVTRVDYAGKEGLNVLVQVYYNVKLLDPLYAAIIPNGFVHLAGEVQMQNEGIDSALGSLPPAGIEPPEAPEGLEYEPGVTNPPIVLSLDGSTVDVGSDLRVKLEYHEPGQTYDVYLYSLSLGYVSICPGVYTQFGSQEETCHVPASARPGPYQLVSIAVGGTTDPANHVGEGDFVELRFSEEPRLSIDQGNRWPRGSIITFQLLGHEPCPAGKSPCPPYQEYDIALIGGGFTAPGQVISTVQVDEFGSASLVWTIPSSLNYGTYSVKTYRKGDTDFNPVAETVLDIVRAEIVIQGGNEWPAGTTIRVHLRGHAPNRTYRLRWIDGRTGVTTDFGPVTTDQFGNTQAPVQFRIPASTADSPPDHRIISFEEGGSGEEVARTDVEVFTPEDAFIVVVGGNDLPWPAGSLIQIELHKHYDGPYDLYFGDTRVESDISPNASGFYQTTYLIPIATPDGTHEIRTERQSDSGTEATTTIDVESVPLIRLKEGDTVQPLSDITIQLLHHVPNDSYQIFLDGNFLFSLPTDGVGGAEQVYDLSNLPNLEGGPFLLESRRDGQTIASTEIFIIAADLEVTNIEFPPGPPINEEIQVKVTVRNNSPVSVSGEYFDVDLYLDPLHPPTTSSQFPPGDYKLWIDSIAPMGTVEVVFDVILRGTNHTVYGRVDTSNYIAESDETNNIYQMTVSGGCLATIGDALSSGANWTGVGYGDADNGSFSVNSGRINLISDGSNDFGSSDNMYLAYYNPQTLSGDFEVRVRMRAGPGEDAGESNWARAGLQIRADVASPSSAKVDLAVANSGHVGFHAAVQSIYRDGGDATRPGDAALDVQVSYPVWLRIVRSGDRFLYYYSDSNAATPPAENEWIAHGSVGIANMGEAVTVGVFNASYHQNNTDTSSFHKFHICLKGVSGPPPGDDFPPGLTVCSGNLLENSGFESPLLSPWTALNGAVNKNPEAYEGQFSALMYTYIPGAHQQPELRQAFSMPEWVISSTTTIDLSLFTCVRDQAGSGAEPGDQLNAGLWSIAGTPTLISDPVAVADGGTDNSGPCSPSDYVPYSTDLAEAIKTAGGNPEDYAEQSLEFSLYDFSSDLSVCNAGGGPFNPACYETDFRVDNVELEVCTTQPIPPSEPGKATVGGPLRVFIGGAPQPKQGVRVWTYKRNGELLTTYSLHDSNYFFYNVDPGEYVIYSEYWNGPNLYSAFTTVGVNADQTITDLSLLLR